MANNHIKVAPSILSADFSRLGEQVQEASEGGADYIHVDIMDGRFVPTITFGPEVVRSIRKWTKVPLDVHMMVEDPGRYVEEIADAGADMITVHAEACKHLHRVIDQIKNAGVKPGVAINPATPIAAIKELIPDLSMVVTMTVNPGFGGQPFIHTVLGKIQRLREVLDRNNPTVEIEVDGGIKTGNAQLAVDAGAQVLVAGSAVYGSNGSVAEAITNIRTAGERAS